MFLYLAFAGFIYLFYKFIHTEAYLLIQQINISTKDLLTSSSARYWRENDGS